MNGYVCLWNKHRVEVVAKTSLEARDIAMPFFKRLAGRKKIKPYDITVVLCEQNGEQVTHTPDF